MLWFYLTFGKNMFLEISAILLAYCLGSLSCAVITCKILGLPDPRGQGSGNPGATNVLRFGGKKAAIITLLGDTLKGVIPVLLVKWLGFSDLTQALVAFAAFLGHLYPIFFRFQGGKGVATALGSLIALSWPVGLSLCLTWLIIAFLFRYSSLAALISALLAPIYTWYFTNMTFTAMVIVMSLLLIFRHRQNIQKLLQGKESKIGRR
jgi:glycerol-3-phosphate acyltransferase PlsY